MSALNQTADVLLNRLKLKPLLIFSKVLSHQSIGHAARELNLTQSAVTKAIQELEWQLGAKLFERSNRGVQPNACAFLLGERVTTILAELRHLTDEVHAFNDAQSGHVVVGTLISASAQLLPQAILLLKEKSPHVLITVKIGTTDELFPALATGELDMVVGRFPDKDSVYRRQNQMEHQAFYQERLSIVVGHQHPLINAPHLSFADLQNYPWVLPPVGSALRKVTQEFFTQVGLQEPRNVVESVSLVTNINLLLDSHAIAFMPSVAAQKFINPYLLATLPFGEVGRAVDVGVSTYAQRKLSPAGYQMIACLKESAARLKVSGAIPPESGWHPAS